MSTNNREFFYRKLHSLLGVIPVGAFLIVHLTVNYYAVQGEEAYNQAVAFMESLPFVYVLEIFLIFLPLLFHAIYGMYIVFQAKNNTSTYSYFRNWMFMLQRVSGVIVFIFVVWHVWDTRIQKMFGAEVNFDMMVDIVQNPIALVGYIIGITAATFHFANGIWAFLITWGITVSPRSQKISQYITMGIFVILTFVGIRAILAFVI
ncbi:succinate dehydrogenase cytochrome b558 subunit [Salisediminibacterium selenitireducens]|uniref:Succinate dehydrogenase (Or fumarate reductase) cytochrome b subunit, b558 family n=1 Tax=Bacillus selenitireducens (strain ATCC 700615 / DSM 15326 / MLS10) TaxID=439292 RepID=D6XSX8_BACIE|nr:succinate dehydrogenase cytochrome b558 subunit [Salisediminibacterium selenitireducens]ADH98914.1 succinate dehydrogenase (or fumarate reductase) cytochrome b subunit, b558 family [[Bacillus] selenitireducens MLS10]